MTAPQTSPRRPGTRKHKNKSCKYCPAILEYLYAHDRASIREIADSILQFQGGSSSLHINPSAPEADNAKTIRQWQRSNNTMYKNVLNTLEKIPRNLVKRGLVEEIPRLLPLETPRFFSLTSAGRAFHERERARPLIYSINDHLATLFLEGCATCLNQTCLGKDPQNFFNAVNLPPVARQNLEQDFSGSDLQLATAYFSVAFQLKFYLNIESAALILPTPLVDFIRALKSLPSHTLHLAPLIPTGDPAASLAGDMLFPEWALPGPVIHIHAPPSASIQPPAYEPWPFTSPLTPQECSVVETLRGSHHPMTLSEIRGATQEDVTSSAIAKRVKGLEARGLVMSIYGPGPKHCTLTRECSATEDTQEHQSICEDLCRNLQSIVTAHDACLECPHGNEGMIACCNTWKDLFRDLFSLPPDQMDPLFSHQNVPTTIHLIKQFFAVTRAKYFLLSDRTPSHLPLSYLALMRALRNYPYASVNPLPLLPQTVDVQLDRPVALRLLDIFPELAPNAPVPLPHNRSS